MLTVVADNPAGQQPGPAVIQMATVSLVDVFTKQIEMQGQLAVIHEKLADIPDHEARLRVLETTRARLYGACILLGAVAGTAAAWVTLLVQVRR